MVEAIILFLLGIFKILGLLVGCLIMIFLFFAIVGAFVEAWKRSGKK